MEGGEFYGLLRDCKTGAQCINVLAKYIEEQEALRAELEAARAEYDAADKRLSLTVLSCTPNAVGTAGKKMAELALAKKGIEIPFLT